LAQNKAERVLNISLKGKSELADNMVLASGTSNRHVSSLAEKVVFLVKKKKRINVRAEGLRNSDWVLLDCGDVIVHIFRQEVRDFYQLERMWQHASDTVNDLENL
tara:strand:+ start:255 stop:569 length:315 start_codon:yes stop_codon:yes gene_type:complete